MIDSLSLPADLLASDPLRVRTPDAIPLAGPALPEPPQGTYWHPGSHVRGFAFLESDGRVLAQVMVKYARPHCLGFADE
jgi:hypothetical protein